MLAQQVLPDLLRGHVPVRRRLARPPGGAAVGLVLDVDREDWWAVICRGENGLSKDDGTAGGP